MTELSPEELKERHAELISLLEASKLLSSTLDLPTLLKTIMEISKWVMKVEASSLMLYDEERQELVFDVALGEKGEAVKKVRLRLGEGIAGWVAKEGRHLMVNDVSQDPRFSSKADEATGFKTRAILAVPIMAKEKIIGVMEVVNKLDGTAFDEHDVELFTALASQAAVAIENARYIEGILIEKQKVDLLFTEMPDGVVVTDEGGKITLINQTAAEIFGVSRAEAAGQDLRKLTESLALDKSLDQVILSSEKYLHLEIIKPGLHPQYYSTRVSKILGEKGETVELIIVLRDVTEEKRGQRLKSEFLALISHKLRTPMTSILGFTDILRPQLPKFTESQQKALNVIYKESRQLNGLIDKLLAFTTVEGKPIELHPEAQTLAGLIEEAKNSLREKIAEKKIDLRVRLDENIPPVSADHTRVLDILKNLLENAIKFNRDGGWVEIGAQSEEENFLKVTVLDSGAGIPHQDLEKIFKGFYQVEESFTGQTEGAGLGLALARKLAEAHGGKLWAESDGPGKGSRFIFTLPIAAV